MKCAYCGKETDYYVKDDDVCVKKYDCSTKKVIKRMSIHGYEQKSFVVDESESYGRYYCSYGCMENYFKNLKEVEQ